MILTVPFSVITSGELQVADVPFNEISTAVSMLYSVSKSRSVNKSEVETASSSVILFSSAWFFGGLFFAVSVGSTSLFDSVPHPEKSRRVLISTGNIFFLMASSFLRDKLFCPLLFCG